MKAPGLFSAAALMACLGLASPAFGYCQTTTCLPSISCTDDPEQCCILDRDGCDTNGIVITWPSECTGYAIQKDGSPKRDISAGQLSDAVDQAFVDWTHADCGPTKPSIRLENFGLAECNEVQVNSIASGPNANIWMFRDDAWPHEDVDEDGSTVSASALALTTVTFNYKTGEMLDADVEINSAEGAFTVGDDEVIIDLQAIVTHEAGHFLGLDHTNDTTATMAPGYVPRTIDQRTLAPDDEAGICASYPDGRQTSSTSCDPRGTFSTQCGGGGCSVAGAPGSTNANANWLLALGAASSVGLGARSRRHRRVGRA